MKAGKIRVSYGTAQVLDLKNGRSKEEPTTAYLMLPAEKCRGGCTFCTQARGEKKWLSRVSWPLFDLKRTKDRLKENSTLSRVCLQSPDFPEYEKQLRSTVKELDNMERAVSVSAPPLDVETLEELKDPVDRIGIGIDSATNDLRNKKKPNYDPLIFWDYLGEAVDIYGEGNVTAHLIVGLGESIEELATAVKRSIDAGAKVSLFSFMGEEDEADLTYYRKAQLTTALLEKDFKVEEAIELVSENPERAFEKIDEVKIFQTRGCPGCNRPYYTSSPGDEHRNYPREPNQEEIKSIKDELISSG